MEALSSFVYRIDREGEHLLKNPEVESNESGVDDFLSSLHDFVCCKAPIYSGEIYGAGSFYDDLKIGAPNEFDYNFTLNEFLHGRNFILQSSEFSGSQNVLQTSVGNQNVWQTSVGDPIFKFVKFIDNDFARKWTHNEKTINVGTSDEPEYILSPVGVKNELVNLIDSALNTISLPPGLSVIGIVDLSGPAVSIDLKWNGDKFKNLTVNIDISLAIDIPCDVAPVKPLELLPENHLLYYVMEEYVNQGHGYAVVPFVGDEPTECWRISTGYLESFIFQVFERDGNEKCLIRFMKTVKEAQLLHHPDGKYTIQMKSSFLALDCGTMVEPDNKQTLGSCPVTKFGISSYNIKQIFFYMLRDIDCEKVQNLGIGYVFVEMVKRLFVAVKSETLVNFFNPSTKLSIPSFDDCYECFEIVLSMVKDVFDQYDVPKEDRKEVWEELRMIYEEIKPIYDPFDIDTEYEE